MKLHEKVRKGLRGFHRDFTATVATVVAVIVYDAELPRRHAVNG